MHSPRVLKCPSCFITVPVINGLGFFIILLSKILGCIKYFQNYLVSDPSPARAYSREKFAELRDCLHCYATNSSHPALAAFTFIELIKIKIKTIKK